MQEAELDDIRRENCVKLWLGRISPRYGYNALRILEQFRREKLAEHPRFGRMGWSALVEWQRESRGVDRYEIPRLAQDFVNARKDWRYNYQTSCYTYIASFFLHNLAEWPKDPTFRIHSEVAPVRMQLNFEGLKRIILNCGKRDKAVYLLLAQTLLDEAGFFFVNTHYASLILEAKLKRSGIVKLTIPGRKQTRNVENYDTFLEVNVSDFAVAFDDYLKSLPELPREALFLNQWGKPLTKQNLIRNFHERAISTGVVKRWSPQCSVCGGTTVWFRDRGAGVTRNLSGYRCQECKNVVWSRELTQTLQTIRYGASPHLIRDVMRSRWREANLNTFYAERMMGHTPDPLRYDQAELTPLACVNEFRKWIRWSNVISDDPNKVDRQAVDEELELNKRALASQARELAEVKRKIAFFDDPKVLEFLKRKLKEE